MPTVFFIDVPLGVVFSKGVGAFGLTEALDYMDRLQAHPDFRPGLNQLTDFREISPITLTHREVSQVAARRLFSDQSRRALVVTSEVQFGLARMFATLREFEGESGIQVFREMALALPWLSLSSPHAASAFSRLRGGDLSAPH